MAETWQPVSSRAIDAYRWHDGVLALRFRDSGSVYEYACDEALLARFLAAESKGAFVNQVLKPLEQRARTRAQFARQAETFESPTYLFTDESILDWIAEHARTRATDRILDVAGGTGALARRLVRDARAAVVLDLVPEMLAAAPRVPDVLYVLGDATAMPFADGQFDLIVSRFAIHHLDDPLAAFHEMARVAAPNARIAIVDMVDGGHRHNELERLRDPSHTAALDAGRLVELLHEAGWAGAAIAATRAQSIDAERWLAQAHGDRETVAQALREEAEGGPPTGLRATDTTITQTWVIVSA